MSGCFCATTRMRRGSLFMAASSAWIDFSRPTNSGLTMCGYSTTSRSGMTGSVLAEEAAGTMDSVTDCSSEPRVWAQSSVMWGRQRVVSIEW